MKKILITGGTAFVSKYAAEYFVNCNYDVYVLNRNSKPQVTGVNLIERDRHNLGDLLKDKHFDVVADITAYNAKDIVDLYHALGSFGQYIMISSSAVYPEYGVQPFLEESEKAVNKFWGKYGTDKIEAERALLERVRNAYILRPPYLYGPMNNVYREAFVFDCAKADRKFYLPKDGEMKMQLLHVKDLCRLMEVVINAKPSEHVLNVGNTDAISIKDWVKKCYECLGKVPEFVNVYDNIEQRNYFCFHDYEYFLDVQRQNSIYPECISLEDGLKESAEWYFENESEVNKKPYIDYIETNLVWGQVAEKMSLKELWELFPISLVAHNDKWKIYYDEMEAFLKDRLSGRQIERISHIGSTAIGGIWAKNIVDILIEAAKDSDIEEAAKVIEASGFIRMSTGTGRISFNRGYTRDGFADKVFHVHLRYIGDNDELYFRDYLNEHVQIAKEYEAIKLRLWKQFEHDRDAYTNAKAEFVRKWTDEARKAYLGRY